MMENKKNSDGSSKNDKFFVAIPNGFVGDSLLHPKGSIYHLSINDKYNKLFLTVLSPYGDEDQSTYNISIDIEKQKSVQSAIKKIFDHTGASEDREQEFFNFLKTFVVEASAFYNHETNDRNGFPVTVGKKVREANGKEYSVIAVVGDNLIVESKDKEQKCLPASDVEKCIKLNQSCAMVAENRHVGSKSKDVATFIDLIAQKADVCVETLSRIQVIETYGPVNKIGTLYLIGDGVASKQNFINVVNEGLKIKNMSLQVCNDNVICVVENKMLKNSHIYTDGKEMLINESVQASQDEPAVCITNREYVLSKNNEIKKACESLSKLRVQKYTCGQTPEGKREEYDLTLKEYVKLQKIAENLRNPKTEVCIETSNVVVNDALKKAIKADAKNTDLSEVLKSIGTETCNENFFKISYLNTLSEAWDTSREVAKFVRGLYEKGKLTELCRADFNIYLTSVILVGLSEKVQAAIIEYVASLIGEEITYTKFDLITSDVCEIILNEYEMSDNMQQGSESEDE